MSQQCSICEKPLYGHPDVKGKPLVCGSCPLQKSKGGKSGKGEFEVRLGAAKLWSKSLSKAQELPMKKLIVKSNFARNRVILLAGGKHVLKFDSTGTAEMPAHLREVLELEMNARQGRFWIVEDAPVVSSVVEEAPPAPPVPEESPDTSSKEPADDEVDTSVEQELELEMESPKEEKKTKSSKKKVITED